MKNIAVFSVIFLICAYFCGCGHIEAVLRSNREIFNDELKNIYDQQLTVRRVQILNSLQQEYSHAKTLSNLANLELMLENFELSDIEKNKNILLYCDLALLYMQINLFPEDRDNIIAAHIKNALLYESGSIFLNITVNEKFLAHTKLHTDNAMQHLQKRISSNIDNSKLEYSVLRINDINALKNIPPISYPVSKAPEFKDLEAFRMLKSANSSAADTARPLYAELQRQFGSKLPLILIKILYQAPSTIIQFYYNDTALKKDLYILLTELMHLYQSEHFFNVMQNALALHTDMQQAISADQTLSAQMLEAALKSELAYQLACLKMLSYSGISPFDSLPAPRKTEQFSSSRAATLKLLFHEILDEIK